MARLKRDIIDYFPHPVKDGERMDVMETTYGDKGYACYYKLLGYLGKSDGHTVDFSDDTELLKFSGRVKADKVLTIKMLNTMADLKAIDRSLWYDHRIVWCQELVDSVADLYKDKRHREPPSRPNKVGLNNNALEITDTKNPQSKVKESRVEESKVDGDNAKFSKICLSDQIWIENMCRVHKKIAAQFPDLLDLFNAHQITTQSISQSLKDFKQHFNSWLRKQPAVISTTDTNQKNY